MTRTLATLAALTALTVTACTPAQQEAWKAMSAQERENYVPPAHAAKIADQIRTVTA